MEGYEDYLDLIAAEDALEELLLTGELSDWDEFEKELDPLFMTLFTNFTAPDSH